MPGDRLTRQELKSQDEITSSLQSFTELLAARKKEVLIAVSAIVIVTIAIVGWRTYAAKREAAAAAQLGEAIAAYEDSNAKPDKVRYEKAAAEAQKAIDGYSSTSAGTIAKYYLGMSQDRLGDTANAEKNLKDVADHANGTIKGVAQFALAHIQSQHKESAKAIENLTQLYGSGNYPKSAVAYDLASLYEADGKKDEAAQYYGKVILESPESRFRQDSEAALKRLDRPIPSPPAPAAPPVKP